MCVCALMPLAAWIVGLSSHALLASSGPVSQPTLVARALGSPSVTSHRDLWARALGHREGRWIRRSTAPGRHLGAGRGARKETLRLRCRASRWWGTVARPRSRPRSPAGTLAHGLRPLARWSRHHQRRRPLPRRDGGARRVLPQRKPGVDSDPRLRERRSRVVRSCTGREPTAHGARCGIRTSRATGAIEPPGMHAGPPRPSNAAPPKGRLSRRAPSGLASRRRPTARWAVACRARAQAREGSRGAEAATLGEPGANVRAERRGPECDGLSVP